MVWTSPCQTGAMSGGLRIVPANQASWADVERVFSTPGDPRRCWCQWFKTDTNQWSNNTVAQRRELLRDQTAAGQPEAGASSGLIALLDDEPVGWVAVEPRASYQRLRRSRLVWQGRDEDKDDPEVWAITCFVVRPEHRGSGIMRAMAAAAAEYARDQGASAVEGYARVPGDGVSAYALYVGTPEAFLTAGFAEVARPSATRVVLRREF